MYGSLLNRVPYVLGVPAWFKCHVQNAHQLLSFICQRANLVPIIQFCLPKDLPIFQVFFKIILQFLNFSIMLNISKFQEYLGNSRKLISRNKEFKFCHFQNFIKEKPSQPKHFDFVFNGAHWINPTIIWLV